MNRCCKLTPKLREELNNRIEQGRIELSLADLHPTVKLEIDRALSVAKDIMACLPDGTFIPIRRQA